jgi:hypothetical protein
MSDADLAEVEFLLGWCAHCAREVLTATTSAGGGTASRACVHCDAAIDGMLSRIPGDELAARGYGVIEDTSGCGRPDCGGGRCGTRTAAH